MAEEVSIQQTQPEIATALPTVNRKPAKYALFGLLGLFLACGLVWAGYQVGKSSKLKAQSSKPQLKTENLTPTLTPVVTFLPTSSPELTPFPLPSEASAKEGDETAGWKTYTSQEGKFSIKYPSNWPYVKGKTYEGDMAGGTLEKIHFGTNDPDADNKPDEVIMFAAVYKDSSIG